MDIRFKLPLACEVCNKYPTYEDEVAFCRKCFEAFKKKLQEGEEEKNQSREVEV